MNLTLNQIEKLTEKDDNIVKLERLLKNDLKGYKGCVLPGIAEAILNDGIEVLESDIDIVLKAKYFETTEISCKDMTLEQLRGLKETGKIMAVNIGLDIDENNGINFKWNIY